MMDTQTYIYIFSGYKRKGRGKEASLNKDNEASSSREMAFKNSLH
jgi:hypothetical protein